MISDVKVAPTSPEQSAVDPHSDSEEEALSLRVFFSGFLAFNMRSSGEIRGQTGRVAL